MSAWEKDGESDEWYTPKYVFDALDCEFDMDVAAPVKRQFVSVPAKTFITKKSLDLVWNGFVWMNPPFSGRNSKAAWLDKIYEHGFGIALTPDRSSAPWWQKAARQANGILFVAGKIKFLKPDGTTGDSPSNGTTLFAYGAQAVDVLKRADKNGLGIFKN
jgi:hypothetical protein